MKKTLNHFRSIICGVLLLSATSELHAVLTNEWICSDSDTSASNPENWSLLHVPTEYETVLLSTSSASNMTWNVENAVAGWVQTEGYSATVTVATAYSGHGAFTNFLILGDCIIEGGQISHPANTGGDTEKELLFMTVNGSFTLGQNALIDVSGKGFEEYKGPGSGGGGVYGAGATHGGVGGSAAHADALQLTYGSITSPTNHGSGAQGRGGGTVVLNVGQSATIHGDIRANGVGGGFNTSGAGGSIWLTAASLSGSGALNVSGVDSFYGGAGGGGRISVVLEEGGSTGDVVFSAVGGTSIKSGNPCAGGAGTIYLETASHEPGCGLLIIANSGYAPLPSNRSYTLMPLAGQYRDGPVNLDDFAQIFISDMGVLAVNSDTVMTDFSAERIIGSSSVDAFFNIQSTNGIVFPQELTVDGYCLIMDTPAQLPGSLTVSSSGKISHSRNGSSADWKVDLKISEDLTIASGGSISADQSGFSSPYHNKTRYNSSSHGGRGHWATSPDTLSGTYGSVIRPTLPGSHANYYGGGAIKLEVGGTTTIQGDISAKAQQIEGNESNGSGGSIWLITGYLTGSGVLDAMGGRSRGNGGGGGRISVMLTQSDSFGDVAMKAYGGEDYWQTRTYGAAGTVYRQTVSQGDGCGDVIVSTYPHFYTNNWDTVYTEIPANHEASADELLGVTLHGLTNCAIGLSSDLRIKDIYLMRDDVKLLLNGHTLWLDAYYHPDWGDESWVVYDGGEIIWRSGAVIIIR